VLNIACQNTACLCVPDDGALLSCAWRDQRALILALIRSAAACACNVPRYCLALCGCLCLLLCTCIVAPDFHADGWKRLRITADSNVSACCAGCCHAAGQLLDLRLMLLVIQRRSAQSPPSGTAVTQPEAPGRRCGCPDEPCLDQYTSTMKRRFLNPDSVDDHDAVSELAAYLTTRCGSRRCSEQRRQPVSFSRRRSAQNGTAAAGAANGACRERCSEAVVGVNGAVVGRMEWPKEGTTAWRSERHPTRTRRRPASGSCYCPGLSAPLPCLPWHERCSGTVIVCSGNPLADLTLAAFLDKFVTKCTNSAPSALLSLQQNSVTVCVCRLSTYWLYLRYCVG
jgi:hypothetical protein